MPARKGTKPPAAGKGRKRGSRNVVTNVGRQAFVEFVEGNWHMVGPLFLRVAATDPGKALELIVKFAGFCLPQLQRVEVKGDGPVVPPPNFGVLFTNGGPGMPVHGPRTDSDPDQPQDSTQ